MRTTTNQRYETAEKRIGLPVRRLNDAREQVIATVWSMVTEDEKSLLAAVLNDGYTLSGIGELDPNHHFVIDAVRRPQQIMAIADHIGSAATIDLPQAKPHWPRWTMSMSLRHCVSA